MEKEFERVFVLDSHSGELDDVKRFLKGRTPYSSIEVTTHYFSEEFRVKREINLFGNEITHIMCKKEFTGISGIKTEESIKLSSDEYGELDPVLSKLPWIHYHRITYDFGGYQGISFVSIDTITSNSVKNILNLDEIIQLIEVEFMSSNSMNNFDQLAPLVELNTDVSVKYKIAKDGSY